MIINPLTDRYGPPRIEKRAQFLERIAAMLLTLRGRGHFTDGDVGDAVRLALVGMVHRESAA